ncbi:1-acyl-sn-glycerol-3-phosphate acyltransferase [Algivirga pacifica]|uniref:Phospholipid/glycerol acyltransferase domain-containing protein n=1 Tax=Algivirga pacifica TaxID=1162670 RepID=A0ABP9DAL7_9BACT
MNKQIGDHSRIYGSLKKLIALAHNQYYYRKVSIVGRENLPKKGAVILAPNHPNHLMDPLAVLFTTKGQPVFMARADIFKQGTIAKILTFLKILPIYRIRDGFKTVTDKNDLVFEIAKDHLIKERTLVIHPEGSTEGTKRLRGLKKGLARLAFQSSEDTDHTLDLKVVPVGIDYGSFSKQSTDLLVQYGKPIDLKDYISEYEENPVKTINQFTKDVQAEMKELLLHIPDQEVFEVANLYERKLLHQKSHLERIQATQQYADHLKEIKEQQPEPWKNIQAKANKLTVLLNKMGVKKRNIGQFLTPMSIKKGIGSILSAPLFLWGVLHHIIPLFLSHKVASTSKDKDAYSMFRFAVSLLSLPLFYSIYTGIIASVTDTWEVTLTYALSLPLSGLFANKMRYHFEHTYFRMKWYWTKAFNKKTAKALLEEEKELTELIYLAGNKKQLAAS